MPERFKVTKADEVATTKDEEAALGHLLPQKNGK